MDLQRDFTVASPAEFVTRFGGTRVIEKVNVNSLLDFFQIVCFLWKILLHCFLISALLVSFIGTNSQQWHSCGQMHALHPSLGLRDVPQWKDHPICSHGHPWRLESQRRSAWTQRLSYSLLPCSYHQLYPVCTSADLEAFPWRFIIIRDVCLCFLDRIHKNGWPLCSCTRGTQQ